MNGIKPIIKMLILITYASLSITTFAQIEPDDIYWHDMGIPGPPFQDVTELSVLGADLWAAGHIGVYYGVSPSHYVSTIAKWDGADWIMMGESIDGEVHVLCEYNGDIYAGGRFTQVSGVVANSIAYWDGASWQPLAGGITEMYSGDEGVLALQVYDGMLWVAGDYQKLDGTIDGFAAWDGSVWHDYSQGGHPRAMTVFEGNLIIAGNYVASYNPDPLIGWQSMGSPNGTTNALTVYDGTLIAGGSYQTGDMGIVYWTGSSWAELGWQIDVGGDGVIDFTELGGDLFISGSCWLELPGDPPDVQNYPVVGWNGVEFYSVGTVVDGGPGFLAVYSGLLSSGGVITPGQQSGVVISRWSGSEWQPLDGPGMEGSIEALATLAWDSEGPINLYAAGDFHFHDGLIDTRDIIEWDGSAWQDLGTGTDGQIYAMTSDGLPISREGSQLFVAGNFSTIDGVPANNIAVWDNSSWAAMGTGISDSITCLCVGPGGVGVVAGGAFAEAGGVGCDNIAWWHSGAWHPMGSGLSGTVIAMARSGDNLVVVGSFTTAGGISSPHIARWNGTEWHAMIPPVHPQAGLSLTTIVPTNGRLPFADGFLVGPTVVDMEYWPNPIIGGDWVEEYGLTATDGTSWCVRTDYRSEHSKEFMRWYGCELIAWAIPNVGVDGPLIVTETAEQSLSAFGFLQRSDGDAWYKMGSGIGLGLADMLEFEGELIVAGSFTMAGGKFANGLAAWNKPETDTDGDGIPDGCDNCIQDYNPEMTDTDADGAGDACDQCPGMDLCDNDFDGLPGGCDNCPDVANVGQEDLDGDGIGDVCDDCCLWRVGDANSSGDDEPTIGDVSVLIDAKFISGTCDGLLACLTEADINQSGGAEPTCDDLTIGDISILIDYLFITGPSLGLPDCL